jgi:hypothetical protein
MTNATVRVLDPAFPPQYLNLLGLEDAKGLKNVGQRQDDLAWRYRFAPKILR